MPQPLMPQGVEHLFIREVDEFFADMPQPLMPQGVEHDKLIKVSEELVNMPQPLMPQGVEHWAYSSDSAIANACHNL